MNGLQDYTLSDRFFAELREVSKISDTQKAKWLHKPGHRQKNYRVTARYPIAEEDAKLPFNIFIRQNNVLEEDFSCGIRLQGHILARYNGPHRDHKNGAGHEHPRIVQTCHIHKATERALREGKRLEFYATPTDRYNDVEGALACLLEDFNVSGIEAQHSMPRLV